MKKVVRLTESDLNRIIKRVINEDDDMEERKRRNNTMADKSSTSQTFKYYAFDWDDNVMNMPTKIMVLDDHDNEIGMSTDDFAEHRHDLGKKPFIYNGKTIIYLGKL